MTARTDRHDTLDGQKKADDRGQAETVGTILFVAVAVITTTTVGFYYIGFVSDQASDAPQLDIVVEVDDGNITVIHNGGESLERGSVELIVENRTGRTRVSFAGAGRISGDDGDGVFEPGERWQLPTGTNPGESVSVSVAVVDESSSSVVFAEDVQAANDKAPPTVDVRQPNATSTFEGGNMTTIRWTASDNWNVTTVNISYSNDNGKNWSAVVTDTENDGNYDWTVPDDDTSEALIRVSVTDGAGNNRSDTSAAFTVGSGGDVTPPSVDVTDPNGGETVLGGETTTVTWSASDSGTGVDRVDIQYSTDDGSTWSTVVTDTENDGSYDWTVPADDTAEALIRVTATDAAGNDASDASDAIFTVDSTPPSVQSASVEDAPINQSEAKESGTRNVTVVFTEAMNTSVQPTITLTDISGSYTPKDGAWTDDRTFVQEVSFSDNDAGKVSSIEIAGAEDEAGLVQSPNPDASEIFVIDTQTPGDPNSVTTLTDPINRSTQEAVRVEVVNPDNVAGDETIFVRLYDSKGETVTTNATLDPDGTTVVTLNASSLADGIVYAKAKVVDDAGNENPSGFTQRNNDVLKETDTPEVTSVTVGDAPIGDDDTGTQTTVTVTFDDQMDTSVDPTVEITGLDRAYTVTRSDYSVNGGTATWTGTVTFADDDEDATGTVEIRGAEDRGGNEMTANTSTTFEVGTKAPTVSDVQVTDVADPDGVARDGVVNGGDTVEVTATVTDASGVDSVTVDATDFGAGTVTLTRDSGDTYTKTFTVDGPNANSDGSYALNVTASDGVGNAQTAQTDPVELDRTPPAVTSGDFTASAADDTIEMTIESNEPLSDIRVGVDGPESVSATLTEGDFSESKSGGTYTYTVTYIAPQSGDYEFTLSVAADETGNDGGDDEAESVTVSTEPKDTDGDGGTQDEQTKYVEESASTAGGNGKQGSQITFDLENPVDTGDGPVTVTAISIDSTSSDADFVKNNPGIRAGDTVIYDQSIELGSTAEFDGVEIDNGETITFDIGEFRERKGNGNGNGGQKVDMMGETVTITVYFEDGSTDTYTLEVSEDD